MKSLLLGITLLGITTIAVADQAAPMMPYFSDAEKQELKTLQCQPQDVVYQNGRMLLGNDQGTPQQLFLIKNVSNQNLLIDFPEGHIGATAWISQTVPQAHWMLYLYLKGQGQLIVENQQNQQSKVRPYWTCTTDQSGMQTSHCQQLAYVCEVTGFNAQGTESQRLAYTILTKGNVSWWLGVGSTIKATLQAVVNNKGFVHKT